MVPALVRIQMIFLKFIKEKENSEKNKDDMTRTSLKEILKCKDKKPKEKAMYEAHLKYGYTL